VNTETNINYGFAVDYFKRTSSLGLLTFVISFLMRFISTSKFNTIENLVIPALLLYFVTTVFLLRILRSLEYKPEDKKIISINIRYAFLFIILSFSLSVPFIRDKLFYAFNFLFSLLFWGFTSLISVVFIIVAYIGGKIAYYILSFLASSDVLSRTMGREVKLSPILKDITRLLRERPNIQSDFLDNVLRISYYILVIGGVIFIIFWILRRVRNSAKREENYIEEKEFILPSINPIQKLFSLFRGSNLGVIREYYRKYLLESREKGVEINPSDTTFDIYNKTLYIFDSNATKRMRDIYIRVRYGLENISSELSKEFISLYESLHKKK